MDNKPTGKYAINPGGDVQRDAVLKVITDAGYRPKTIHDWHSRVGFNTIWFEGKLWTNWTAEAAKARGLTTVSGQLFLKNPEKYMPPPQPSKEEVFDAIERLKGHATPGSAQEEDIVLIEHYLKF